MKNLKVACLMMSLLLLFVLFATGGLEFSSPSTVLASSSKTEAAPTSTSGSTATKPASAGKVTVAVATLGDELIDPAKNRSGSQRPILWPFSDPLARPLDDGRFIPALATSWEQSQDGLSWKFILRKDVKFHNGESLTAEDVKFSVERTMNPESKSVRGAEMRQFIKGIEVLDNNTLVVRLNKLYPQILDTFRHYARPASKSHYEKVGDKGFEQNPISAGPYKVKKHARGEYVEFEAFDQYYEGAPSIKTLLIKVVPEASTRLAMLKVGEIDITALVEAQVQEVKKTKGLQVVENSPTVLYALMFCDLISPEPSPFKDKRVRQAVAHAIDTKALIDKVFYGTASAAATRAFPTMPGFDPNLKPHPYDPEKAKALLREAGFPKGLETTLTFASVNTKLYEAVAGYLKAVGINAKLDGMEAGAYYPRLRSKQLRGLGDGGATPTYEPAGQFLYWHSEGAWGYMPKEGGMDDLFQKMETIIDPKERAKIGGEMIRREYNEVLTVPTPYQLAVYGVGPRIKVPDLSTAEENILIYGLHRAKLVE